MGGEGRGGLGEGKRRERKGGEGKEGLEEEKRREGGEGRDGRGEKIDFALPPLV